MSNKKLRNVIRAVHLLASVLIIAFVYSADLRTTDTFVVLIQFIVIPVVGLSGLAMWQQAAITKLRRNGSNRQTA